MGKMTSGAYSERGGAALCYPAATLAFVSELIHLWVLPGQFVASMLPGAFFLLVAIGQGLLGMSLLFGPGRWALRFGIPQLFAPIRMPVGGLDLAATAVEVALVILLVRLKRSLLPKKRRHRARRGTRTDTVKSEV